RSLDAMVLLTRTTKSVREQFGRVIVESQACGVAVIGSRSGAIPDVVGDGGWIVPEHDPEALARQLDVIAADPHMLRARGVAAQSNVRSRFTYEAVAEDLVSACFAASQHKRAGSD
ncbi:MAG: glycosyltransferase, partial [Pseudoxanthomonas sp.]